MITNINLKLKPWYLFFICFLYVACSKNHNSATVHNPGTLDIKEIIDLGALVTEDLPERVWGKVLCAK